MHAGQTTGCAGSIPVPPEPLLNLEVKRGFPTMSIDRNKYVRAFVLLSGGMDSATALYHAADKFRNVAAVSIDYGQRHKREVAHAATLAAGMRTPIPHDVIRLGDLLSGDNVMLTHKDMEIPEVSYNEIKGISPTYVPFRNGTMLSVLTAHAMKYVEKTRYDLDIDRNSPDLKDLVTLFFGAHAEDARNWAYPDCTPEFVGSMANAIYTGSYFTVRLCAPFIHMTKAEIVTRGYQLGVPFIDTWSCYVGGDHHCGVCPTCRARKDAFRIARVEDPTTYEA